MQSATATLAICIYGLMGNDRLRKHDNVVTDYLGSLSIPSGQNYRLFAIRRKSLSLSAYKRRACCPPKAQHLAFLSEGITSHGIVTTTVPSSPVALGSNCGTFILLPSFEVLFGQNMVHHSIRQTRVYHSNTVSFQVL